MKTLLFKPFEKYSEKNLLITGIVFTILGSLSAYYFSFRYDGILDMHFTTGKIIQEAFIDDLINIFTLSSLLFLAAKYLNRSSRFMDILITCMISRTPLYILTLFNLNNTLLEQTNKMVGSITTGKVDVKQVTDTILSPLIITFSIISLVILVWSIALLFNGLKHTTNVKGGVQIILFIASLILAEALSKILIYNLN